MTIEFSGCFSQSFRHMVTCMCSSLEADLPLAQGLAERPCHKCSGCESANGKRSERTWLTVPAGSKSSALPLRAVNLDLIHVCIHNNNKSFFV